LFDISCIIYFSKLLLFLNFKANNEPKEEVKDDVDDDQHTEEISTNDLEGNGNGNGTPILGTYYIDKNEQRAQIQVTFEQEGKVSRGKVK
jgi:hypothetical protein